MTVPWLPVLLGLGAIRVAIGPTPLLAPGPAARLLGFPTSEDTASARVFAGLFGVRDVGLGAIAAFAAVTPTVLLPVLCDLSVFLAAAARRTSARPCCAVPGLLGRPRPPGSA